MIAYTINNEVIVVIVDGVSRVVPRGTITSKKLLAELKKTPIDEKLVVKLACLDTQIREYLGSDYAIDPDGIVTRRGEELDPVLSEMICENFKAGVPVGYLFKFFDRLDANPSAKVKGTLSAFLKHGGMPITKDGHFLAYKGVQANLYSIQAGDSSKLIEGVADADGHICYAVGNVVRVKRNYVADDPDKGCSSGLHAGSERYAEAWARPHNGVVLLVDIDPADVVSVPKDSDCEKLRTCAYKIVARHRGRLGAAAAVRDPSAPYATAYRSCEVDNPLDGDPETIPGDVEYYDKEIELQRKPGRIVITIRNK